MKFLTKTLGQGFELFVPIDLARLAEEGRPYLLAAFQDTHRARYGANPAGEAIEIVTFRLVAEIPTSRNVLGELTRGVTEGAAAPDIETGEISFQGARLSCRFAWRSSLPADFTIAGPAIIEEPTATTLVPPGCTARVGRAGTLVLMPQPLAPDPLAPERETSP